MDVSVKLEAFEGPLDLLLFLINKNKVDIYNIPIAEILRQYMEYLSLMQENRLETATEFSVMAATLIYIKSKMLLPKQEEAETDPRLGLAEALAEYKRFKDISAFFGERLLSIGQNTFIRQPEPLRAFGPEDYRHDPKDLINSINNILFRDERRKPPPREAFSEIIEHEIVSVEAKSNHILLLLETFRSLDIYRLIYSENDKHHAIAAFLAVLDLLRNGTAMLDSGDSNPMLRLCADIVYKD